MISVIAVSLALAAPPAPESCGAARWAADHLAGQLTGLYSERAGWKWKPQQSTVSPNISGLAALALLDASEALNEPAYRATAQRYADVLLSSKRSWFAGDLPYKADIELLARLGGDYLPHGRDAFEAIRETSPTGAAEVARIAAGRTDQPALLGFDVALGIRAALATGDKDYAAELADAVIRRRKNWHRPKENPRFSTLSAAAVIVALEKLDRPSDRTLISEFRRDIRGRQNTSGAWLGNETQPTAYAIMALAGSSAPPDRQAIAAGTAWLRQTMLADGGYAHFNDGLPEPFVGERISEVQAEALMALAGQCRLEKE